MVMFVVACALLLAFLVSIVVWVVAARMRATALWAAAVVVACVTLLGTVGTGLTAIVQAGNRDRDAVRAELGATLERVCGASSRQLFEVVAKDAGTAHAVEEHYTKIAASPSCAPR